MYWFREMGLDQQAWENVQHEVSSSTVSGLARRPWSMLGPYKIMEHIIPPSSGRQIVCPLDRLNVLLVGEQPQQKGTNFLFLQEEGFGSKSGKDFT